MFLLKFYLTILFYKTVYLVQYCSKQVMDRKNEKIRAAPALSHNRIVDHYHTSKSHSDGELLCLDVDCCFIVVLTLSSINIFSLPMLRGIIADSWLIVVDEAEA